MQDINLISGHTKDRFGFTRRKRKESHAGRETTPAHEPAHPRRRSETDFRVCFEMPVK